ncbi:MAG: hypothetical protein ACMUIG_06480 [Thermoplasmatota archaeon]
MTRNRPLTGFAAVLAIAAVLLTSGCFDINTAKRSFFPSEDQEINLIVGTIGEVWYNFTGPYDFNGIRVGRYEKHMEVDNFFIDEGGEYLYLWIQVHFGVDDSANPQDRFINVTLSYIGDDGIPIVRIRKRYDALANDRFDRSEAVGNVQNPEKGIWSLKVDGRGTASGVSYDWFHVSVNGEYPDTSYNNNPPD